MEKSEEVGMQTFDSHLYRLYQQQKISLAEALRNADSANNLKLRISLSAKQSEEETDSLSSLSLEPKAEDIEEEEEEFPINAVM
jgi:twitching motility protein PilU